VLRYSATASGFQLPAKGLDQLIYTGLRIPRRLPLTAAVCKYPVQSNQHVKQQSTSFGPRFCLEPARPVVVLVCPKVSQDCCLLIAGFACPCPDRLCSLSIIALHLAMEHGPCCFIPETRMESWGRAEAPSVVSLCSLQGMKRHPDRQARCFLALDWLVGATLFANGPTNYRLYLAV
jgi:hypothetical protein